MKTAAILLAIIGVAAAGKMYNGAKERCCDGVLHPLDLDYPEIHCCGNITYNSTSFVCCNKNPLPIPQKEKASDEFVCCVDERGKDIVVNKQTNKIPCPVLLECGEDRYDILKSICCKGKVYPRSQGSLLTLCCGELPYNPTDQRCTKKYNSDCSRTEYAISDRNDTCLRATAFCADVEYDIQKKKCCVDTLYDMPEGLTFLQLHTPNPPYFCCGRNLTQNHHDYKGCCNGQIYDSTEHLCCHMTLRKIASKSDQCCHDQIIDGDQFVCCDGKPVAKSDTDKACCTKHQNRWEIWNEREEKFRC